MQKPIAGAFLRGPRTFQDCSSESRDVRENPARGKHWQYRTYVEVEISYHHNAWRHLAHHATPNNSSISPPSRPPHSPDPADPAASATRYQQRPLLHLHHPSFSQEDRQEPHPRPARQVPPTVAPGPSRQPDAHLALRPAHQLWPPVDRGAARGAKAQAISQHVPAGGNSDVQIPDESMDPRVDCHEHPHLHGNLCLLYKLQGQFALRPSPSVLVWPLLSSHRYGLAILAGLAYGCAA